MNPLVYGLLPRLQTLCIQHWMDSAKAGLKWTVDQGFRTAEDQMAIYHLGREQNPDGTWTIVDKKAVRTNALPEQSAHCRRAAYDIAVLVDGKVDWNDTTAYIEIGKIGKHLGLEWGGDWNALHHGDVGHFNLPKWHDYPIEEEVI